MPSILGTIAGDDTVLLVTRDPPAVPLSRPGSCSSPTTRRATPERNTLNAKQRPAANGGKPSPPAGTAARGTVTRATWRKGKTR